MIFQYYYSYGRFGGGFQNLMYWLEYWGIREVLIPFLVIFTVIFAVLQKINLFGKEDKKINIVLATAIALATIIPHSTGYYPPGFDVVTAINTALPEIALLMIAVVFLLILIGLVGGPPHPTATGFTTVIAIASVVIVGGIFVSAIAFPYNLLDWIDPSLLSLIVILLVFGLIVLFVSKEELPQGQEETWGQWVWNPLQRTPTPPPQPPARRGG